MSTDLSARPAGRGARTVSDRLRGHVRRWALARPALAGAVATMLAAALLAPGAVLAAEPLSVTTPYPAVSVAPGTKASFNLSVAAAEPRRVDLAVAGVPDGWTASLRGGGFVVTGVQAAADEPAEVRLDVTVPADAAARTYRLTVTGTSGALSSSLPIDITVSSSAAGSVTLQTDFPSLKGPSSTSFQFNLTLRNDTAQDLTFSLNAQGPTGWTTTAQPTSQSQAATFQVNAGDSAAITVKADPPSDAAAGTYPVQVTATSSNGTVGGELQVEVTGQYAMSLTTPDGRLNANGQAGSVITRTLTIVNTGTAPLTGVALTADLPTEWTVTYDPAGPIASVPAGQEVTVTASIVPAPNAIAGDYVATFRATSSGESVSASTDIRVTIETSLTWLVVGAGIIVIALIVLSMVFQRYGRR
ncbi:MAG: NEW3 domain-containing protein [Chloroflexi bacterium]|nr:NEW3 domain-containing protein [Chloroflexota bacterium]